MRWFFCSSCGRGYNVCGERDEGSRLLSGCESGVPCITPLCRGRLQNTVPQSHAGVRFEVVSLHDFYRAFKGFGISSTAPASLERATKLLLGRRVVAVEGEPIGAPERSIIHCMTLDDGTRLHFDTSAKGACLYYIEEPVHELPSAADPEGRGEVGEEAGRSAQTLPEVIEG